MSRPAPPAFPAPIERRFDVKPPPAKAFEVFVQQMKDWVPPNHSLLDAPRHAVVVEPHIGGAWYEVDAAGTRRDWGQVAVYDPPHHLRLIWRLSPEFQFDPTIETFLDITFTESQNGGTAVHFFHSGLQSYGDKAADMKARLEAPDAWNHWFAGLTELIG